MKEKISITLDSGLVRKMDNMIDGNIIKSRSHAIEKVIRDGVENKVTQAIIACGGEGTRLRPITYEIPKPMIPLKGKPVVEHIMDNLREGGITEIVLSVGHKHEKIISHFGEEWKGVKIRYVIEKTPLGDAGSLHLIKDSLGDAFFMLNGDVLSKIDVRDMLNFHRNSGCEATIALTTVKDPKDYGVAIMKGMKIVRFEEKPKIAESSLINAGMYVMNSSIFEYLPKKKSFMTSDVFSQLAKKGKLAGYVYNGKWFDVGTPERYEKAMKGWK